MLHAINMPLACIKNLPKEEAEKLAIELGVPVQGTFDEFRKRLKEKWNALETYLPPQSEDTSEVTKHTAGDVHDHGSYVKIKLRGKVASDLVKNIPVFSDTESESVFKFLIRAREVYDLGLVTDAEFLTLLVGRTSGRLG
jgi:hypothetical protein